MIKSSPRVRVFLLFFFVLALSLALLVPAWASATGSTAGPNISSLAKTSASKGFEQIREATAEYGAYRFTADIEQTLIPRPLPRMIGQTSQRVDLRLDGDVESPEFSRLNLRFEGGAVSGKPLILENVGGETYLLQDGERTPIENPLSFLGPKVNLLAYLEAAEGVDLLEEAGPEGYVVYGFDIDGPAFDDYVRRQMMLSPDYRPGVTTLSPSPALRKMSGRGELWVDGEGIPQRQIIDLELPEASEEYNARVHMVIDFQFEGTAAFTLPVAAPPLQGNPAHASAEEIALRPTSEMGKEAGFLSTGDIPANSLQDMLPTLLVLLGALMIGQALVFGQRHRRLYRIVSLSLSFVFLATPFFQAAAAAPPGVPLEVNNPSLPEALGMEEEALPDSEEGAEMERELNQAGLVQAANVDPAVRCGKGAAGVDTDNDQLTDRVENCLGTDPLYYDSDRDMITDTVELAGFSYYSRTWYLDPLLGDSNMDGLADFEESPSPIGKADSWDPDNDHVPNPWDDDNDGDGVWDGADQSPFSFTGFQNSFTFTTQVEDSFSGYQYFGLQVRPQNTSHLRYSTSLLDWPHDEKGQLTDLDGSTEDMTIAPMLAITTDQIPEDDLRDLYGLTYFTNPDGSNTLYAPLSPVNDGGQIVAFQTRLAYGPETVGAIEWQEVEFVWLVYMAVDHQNDGGILTEIVPVMSYPETFQLTGWDIGKHQDYDYLLLGMPGTPNDDRDIFQMIFGLSSTFMSNQNPDLDEIDQRFGSNNTDPILTWGVPAAGVEVYRPDPAPEHPDGAIFDMNREVPRFLNVNGYPTDGSLTSLVIATEQSLGETGLDEHDASATGFDINLADMPMATMRHVRMVNLAFKNSAWQTVADDDLIDTIANRHADLSADLAEIQFNYPDVTQTNLEKGIGLMYLQWTSGQTRLISIDGLIIAPNSKSDFEVYTRLDLSFAHLGAFLLAAAGLLREGGGVTIDDPSGMWSYLNNGDSDEFFAPWWLSWAWATGRLIFNTDSNAQVWFSAKAILKVIIGIYLFIWAVRTLVAAAKAGVSVIRALLTGFQLAKTASSWGSWALTIIAVFLYVGLLVVALISANNRYEKRWAITYYVITIVLTLVLALLSFIPGGSILLLLIYLADAIVFFVTGESFLEEIYEAIAEAFYNFEFVTNLDKAHFGGIDFSVTEGIAIHEGTRLSFVDSFTGKIIGTKNARTEDVGNSYVFAEFKGDSSNNSVVVVDKNENNSKSERNCQRNEKTLVCRNEVGVEYQFTAAGVNIPIKLNGEITSVTIVKECTFGFCEYPTETENLPDDLGSDGWKASTLYFDVVPDTLDELWNWNAFTHNDADGDGLLADVEAAICIDAGATCLDPDNWDTDGDGLSDDFEYLNAEVYGTNPFDADSDNDGLTDLVEFRQASLIDTADSDADGLSDDEEVFHQLPDDSWTGGGWMVSVPGGSSYWIFSSPVDEDEDRDGIIDASERDFQTSPFAYDPAPQLALTGEPLATSPSGATAIYAAPGETVSLGLRLENVSVEPITRTLSLCLPGGLANAQGGTMQGWQTPPVQISGSCYSWSFAGGNALQRFEVVSTTLTATAAVSGITGTQNIVATLPHTLAVDGTISDTVPLVVDDDLPTVAIASPADGEIIGGGATAVVVGGISDDASSWVDHVDVTLPGQGTVVVSDTVSPWAATWTLPDGVNGLLNLTAQAVDVTGHASAVDSIQVLVDNYPPVPQLSLTDGQAIPGSGGYQVVIPLSGSASDDDPGAAAESGLERIQLSLDDAPWRTVWTDVTFPLTAGWNVTWTLPGGETVQGEHVVKTRAYDRAGNLSAVVEKTIVVDVLPPTDEQADRSFVTDPPHYQSGSPITLHGVANEAGYLPLAPVPQDLNGTLHSIGDATIWLQADSYAEISNNMTAAWLGDYNGDRLADLAVGLPAANGGAGKVVVVLGAAGDWPVPDLGRALAESTTSFTGLSGAGLGQLIAPAGDMNGDGYADLIVGDQNNDRAFLVFGSLAGRGNNVLLDGSKQSGWVELTTGSTASIEDVAGAGDVNGDGYDDLLMSVDSNGGEAYLLLGEPAPPWGTLYLEDIAAAMIDTAGLATVSGVGDINDDQLADYAVGAGNNVTLYAGEIGLANFSRVPLAAGDALATFASSDSQPAIVPLGPVNGDAYDDFIFSNGNGPTVVFGNGLNTQALTGFSPAANGFLSAAGDVDRDGQNDILIGNANGDAYLLLGGNLSTVEATFTGVEAAASAPYAAGADLNSDGASDLLLVPSSGAAAAVGLEGFGAPAFIDPAWLPQSAAGINAEGDRGTPGPAFLAAENSSAQLAATIRYVDDDNDCRGQTPCYGSIQAAVNASAAGDTIEVMPGVYGSFTVSGLDDLTIGSATVADATFVDGAGGTFAAKISSADGVQLANLTLQNAQYGLWLENAGDGGWLTPADKTRAQGLFIYDFTSHAIYMNRQSTLDLSQTTMAGNSNHLGVYGSASSTADWDGGTSDNRFATNSGGGLLEGSSELYFVHGNGSKGTHTYDPATTTWGTIAAAPYRIGGGSTVTIDGNDDIWLARANEYGQGLNGRIRAVEYVANDQIYVGGNFTQAGGQTAQYVAMWNGSSWESLGPGDSNRPNQQVRALTYDPVNSVLYVGTGQEGNSETNAYLRSWNDSSNSWTLVGTVRNDINYGSNPQNALVNALDYANGVVWVGGHFDYVQKNGGSSIKLNSITKYTVSSGNFGKVATMDNRCDPGMGHQNSGDSIDALVANNTYVFMGGRASDYEGWNPNGVGGGGCFPFPTGSITRLNIATNQVSGLPIQIDTSQDLFQGSYLGKSPGGLGDVNAMDLNGNRLFIGGDFNRITHVNSSSVYNYTSNHFLILDVSNTTTASFDSRWDFNGIVTGVSARNRRVFVTGHFTSGGLLNGTAVSANRIAFIDNSNNNAISAMDGGLSSANSNPKVDHGSTNNIAFIGGNFTSVDGGNLATNRFARWSNNEFTGQGFFQYDNSGNSWSSRSAPGAFFGAATAMASDRVNNIYAILGDNSTAFYRYNISGNSWSTATSLPSAATTGATMKYVDGDIYALLGGLNSKFCRFDPGSSSWDCGLATIPGSVTVGYGASLVWDGQEDIYATIGSNGKQFYSYNIPGDSWTTLGDGSGTTTGDDDTPSAVNAGAGLARNGTTLFLAPGGGVGSLYGYGPVGQIQQRLALADVAIAAPETNSASTWINTNPSNSFQMTASNLVLVGGPSTTWSPDLSADGITPSEVTHTQAAFLDPDKDLYRLTAGSIITAGYHSYRADALVATGGEEFDNIQDAIFSGANRVSVKAGIYEEDLALASGVTVIGAGGSRTIVERPSGSTATAMVMAEGVRGATLRGVALNGDGATGGFLADAGAEDLLLVRNIIHNTGTAIALDGTNTEVEVVNLTVANNTNGLAATNCAPVNVRNTVFAFHGGTGLSYQGCAPTKLHTFNDYWANGTDQSPLAPGSGEIFLNPLFTDLTNYLVEDASPIIDAGAPGDPSPPGAGSRVDMGHVEQSGAAFYADDNYCLTCENDGLTWQVDAFDHVQDALDAAEAELLLLATGQARYSVGIGPGTYAYSITVPSYVSLAGSGAENTVMTDTVYFNGAVQAGLHNMTVDSAIVAVEIDGYASDLSLTHNIFSNGLLGIRNKGGTAVEATFNTLVNNLVGIAAEGSDNWMRATNNILALNVRGMQTLNGGQIFSDYNLLYNTVDYRDTSGGANDITGQPPLFASGGYRLQPASPAVDAADPTEDVPTGGGLQADMGYWELRARPFTLFLGDDNVSTAVATSGVAQVEYAIVPVADSSLPLTGTLPTGWSNVSLNNPNAPVSDWEVIYNPPGSGYYRLYTRATDVVNNLETDETEWFAGAFFVDGANPAVTWLSPGDGSGTAESLELRAQVQDYVAGQFSVEKVHFLVDNQVVLAQWAAEPWSGDGASPRTFRAWVDVSAGSHTASAVAQDKAGNIGLSTTIAFTATAGPLVDSTAPSLTIDGPAADGAWVTATVTISGTASDAGSGLASVEVSFDDGVSWQAATVSGGDWSLTDDLAGEAEVEYVTYVAQVRATDMAGNSTDQARTIIVDNVPPHGLLPVTFSAPPGTHFDQPEILTTTWNLPVDGSGVANVYLAVDNIPGTVPTGLAAGTSYTTTLGADQEWYVHLAAVDIAGNTLVEHFGPWQVGSVDDTGQPLGNRRQTITIDGFIDQSLGEWTDDEALDDDERGLNQPTKRIQTLYATWDGISLYLGWKGAWWDVDGTFWAYLDTGSGGTTMLVGGSTPNVLPFAADLAVSMTDADTGLLWTYDGSNWNSAPLQFAAQGNSGNTELKIPLAVDQVSTLRLVAFADKNDPAGGGSGPSPVRAAAGPSAAFRSGPFGGEIDPWSVFPTFNKLNEPWNSFYEWSGLNNITLINQGQPQAPAVDLVLTSPQPMNVPSGPGETISYTVQLTNLETELVSGLQLSMTVGSSLTLQSVSGATCANCAGGKLWLLDVPDMPAGGSHQIELTAQLASDLQGVKKVKATVGLIFDSEVLDTASLTHAVDGDKPTVKISVPPGSAIGPGQQQFYGTAGDGLQGSGVVKVEVRERNGAWQTAGGTSAWSALVNVTASSGNWELEARATDANGLVSPIALAAFIVDATPPTITVDLPGSVVPGVVNGSVAPVSGLTRDPYPLGSEVDSVATLIDGSGSGLEANVFSPNPDGTQNWLFNWSLPTEDGITHTLQFSATDQVGNIGVSEVISVVVDNVAPALAVTGQQGLVEFGDSSPVISGTIADGHAVSQVEVSVYAPDGSSYQDAAALTGDQWAIGISSQPVLGSYHLWVSGQDLAGNETVLGPFEIYVVSSVSVSDLEVDEAAGNAIVTVSALNASLVDVSVDYATADDVATEPDDYSAVNGTLVIPAGDLTGTISIPLVDDRLDEPDEPFDLQLSNPVHVVIGDGMGQVLILDDDHTPVAIEDSYGTPQNMTLMVTAPGVLENDSDEDGDIITATLATDASHGQLDLITDGSFTYTPTFNYSGDDTFTYYASDGVNNSEAVTVTITVNDPPVITSLVLSPTAVLEDETATLSGTFTDADLTDEHSVSIDWGDLSSSETFSLTVGARTFSATHHYLDDNPPGTPWDTYSITVSLSDSALGNDVVTTTIGITNVNPLLGVDIPGQTLQYSDFISPTTFTVTDVAGDAPQNTGTTWQVSDGAPVAGLPGDLSLMEQGCEFPGINGRSCTWVLSGTVQLPAGLYTVTATFEDDDTGQSAIEAGLTVEPEAAAIAFDGDNPVAVQVTEPESNASLPFEMVVYVEELEPDLAFSGAAPGNIGLAEVSMILEPVGPGSEAAGTCTPILIDDTSDDYGDVLQVICAFDGVPVNTYSVNVLVDGGYYTGYSEDVLVIYDPSLGYTTGGGWFYWPGTDDPSTGYPGDKTNFGYSMSYNQNNLKNVKGSLLLIRHLPDGNKYRVKSNALEGLSLGDVGAYGWASFSGKATYLEPGMLEPEGNHTFLAYVEDHNQPGNGIDKFWLETQDKNGQVIDDLSMDWPGWANAQMINAGNIVVPHSGGGSNEPPAADFTYAVTGPSVDFSDASTDPDGAITAWNWDFGDGNGSAAQDPTHVYVGSGIYNVTLTVTDNDGAIDATSQEVEVTEGNGPPTANFDYSVITRTVTFTDTSSDDGNIDTYHWEFGDGNTTTVQHPVHTYAIDGVYDVVLTVTDDDGASDSFGQQIAVSGGEGGTLMYIQSLAGHSAGDGSTWNASVEVRVMDDAGNWISNATVSGSWSKGFYSNGSCTTDFNGFCTVEQVDIGYKTRNVTFSIDTVTHANLVYDPSLNLVSSIRIERPEAGQSQAAGGEMALVIESTSSEESVVDEDGRRIGLVDGQPVLEMPGVSFLSSVAGGDGRVGAFWLPVGGEYTVEIRGFAEEKIDLQVLVPTGMFSGLVIIFEEVQMMPGSVARLALAEDSGQLSLLVDLYGNGQVDQTILPTQSIEVGLVPPLKLFLPFVMGGF